MTLRQRATARPVLPFDPAKNGLARWLSSDLRADIMTYLWSCERPKRIRQIVNALDGKQHYNTYATILADLTMLGIVKRTMSADTSSRHYLYAPTEPRNVWEQRQRNAIRASLENE